MATRRSNDWIMGRRMDDAGAAVALSALGHVGHRQCAADEADRCALVSSLALRPLARRQRAVAQTPEFFGTASKPTSIAGVQGNCGGAAALICCVLTEDTNNALENQPRGHAGHDPQTDRSSGHRRTPHRDHCRVPLFHPQPTDAEQRQPSSCRANTCGGEASRRWIAAAEEASDGQRKPEEAAALRSRSTPAAAAPSDAPVLAAAHPSPRRRPLPEPSSGNFTASSRLDSCGSPAIADAEIDRLRAVEQVSVGFLDIGPGIRRSDRHSGRTGRSASAFYCSRASGMPESSWMMVALLARMKSRTVVKLPECRR